MICRKMASVAKSFRIGLIQMLVSEDKSDNLRRATQLIAEAKQQGSTLVSLPECFNCPYGTKYFPEYAEPVPDGETCKALSEAAKCNQIYLVGGSIPEICDGKIYNTCTIWGPDGKCIDYHRKVHLFDIDVPGGQKFTESETLSPGGKFTVFSNGICKIGVAICYDLRFTELFRLYRKEDINMVIIPGAFNMTTGPLHWELLMRARAVDEQIFVAACSPAQNPNSDYKSYGHSLVVNPWGKVLKQAEYNEEIVVVDIDLQKCDEIRQSIPTFKQRRTDLYDTVSKCQL